MTDFARNTREISTAFRDSSLTNIDQILPIFDHLPTPLVKEFLYYFKGKSAYQ